MINYNNWTGGTSPLVSLITINYNEYVHTLKLIDSLKKIRYPRYEIIVIDNGSHNGECENISVEHEDIIVIRSRENLGYAGGCNLGAKFSSGKYLMFLNNDIIVDKNFLWPLVDLAERKKYIGAIMPKVLYHEHPELIQSAGYTNFSPLTVRNKVLGFKERDDKKFNTEYQISTFYGAAMFIPSWTFHHVGPINERFFLYYEDHEWAYRIKKEGYSIWYCGGSKVYHKESISIGSKSAFKAYYLMRNRLIFAKILFNDKWYYPFTVFYLRFLVGNYKIFLYKRKKMSKHVDAIRNALNWASISNIKKTI
ncbi:MAG: glycosyltransferase family 2 protein [Hyphomicrobiales bacterium]